LHIRGEREFPVPPLALPDRSQSLELADLQRYAAVALFIERAIASNPDFALTDEVGRNIAQICSRLDGLPLAIELAAARTKLLAPGAMLARLDRRFSLLAAGARDLPERQRTLRGAIAWSYDLLDSSEQELFRHLSIFVGGCSLEAAEFLCGEQEAVSPSINGLSLGPASTTDGDVLDGIASLVDKNLVGQAKTEGSEARFELLETIREFGLEALMAAGEFERTADLHARFFLLLAEEAEPHLIEKDQGDWLHRLNQEHDNLRAALRWCLERGSAVESLRLAGALGQFWQLRGHASEGRQWLEAALLRSGQTPTPERAKALTAAGILALNQHDYEVARTCHEQSLAVHRELGDSWSAAVAINDLGTVALYQGDYRAAQGLYQESLKIREDLGDRRGSSVSLTNLGIVAAAQGDLGRARQFHERGLAFRRELEDRTGTARSLSHLGTVASEQRDYAAARRFLSEAVALAKADGDRQALARSLTRLGHVAFESGKPLEADELLQEAVGIQREMGDRVSIPWSLWHLARLAIARGELSLARTHSDEAIAITRQTGDKHGLALWLNELGDVALAQDDVLSARAAREEDLAVRRQLGDEAGAAVIMAKLAQIRHHDGEVGEARALLEESVRILRRLDHRPALAASLTNLAQLVSAQGEPGTAETLYKEALEVQLSLGSVEMVGLCMRGLSALAEARGDGREAARLLATLESLDDPQRADTNLNLVITSALDLPPQGADPDAVASHPDGLSEREVEVLRLISAGRSNQAIADELVISVNTVFRHVSNVFAKIGASNRVEAASYAQRHGLT
jgi:predicted ATPase/DNA-binding NarL/FixJ family response regulator